MELLKTPLERLAQERQLLTDLEKEKNSFKIQEWNSTDTNELHLNFSLKIGTIDFNGVLVYPELFPELPAYIRPQKSGERWSILHQYGGSGVLCLEYGPDNWNTNISGVDLVRSAQLLLLTDVAGILDKNGKLIPSLSIKNANKILKEKFISGGMKPKIETCINAISKGVKEATILDGRIPHSLILELFTEHGIGTQIYSE